MPDIGTISAALGSIKAASDIAKLIKDSSTSLEEAELKLQIADIIGALAEARMEIANIQEQLLEKDKIIQELSQKLEVSSNVIWEKPYYFLVKDDLKDGPFCQKCYDTDNKLVRLQGGKNGTWVCYKCKSSVRDSTYVKPATPRGPLVF